MNRKITALLLMLVLSCSLFSAGCGPSADTDGNGKTPEEYEEQIRQMQAEIDSLQAELARYTQTGSTPSEELPADPETSSQEPSSEAADGQQTVTVPEEAVEAVDRTQIVVFGDSIWDSSRDDTGIASLLSGYMDADVYNCAIGGTRASMKEGIPTENYDTWESTSLSGMINVAIGKVDPEIFLEGYVAGGVIRNIDFSKTDYFIIAYGLNDYFSGAPLTTSNGTLRDTHGYGGALRFAIDRLRTNYPDAQILLISPTYCQFWKDGVMYDDSNMKDFGGGSLTDYANVCQNIAESENTLYIDAYSKMGINIYTAEKYLEDGVHLTAAGRELYAKAVSSCLKYGKPGEVSGNSIYY